MMEGAREEPMELISCGKCSAVNRVPYGLEQFRCHTCRALVNIAREPSAACAAASPSAQFYDGLANSTGAGSTAAGAAGAENRKASSSSKGGFFGSLTKKMEKVVRSIESGLDSGGKPAPAPATSEPPQRHAPALSAEEEQLQWALNASIEEEKRQHTTSKPREVDVPVNPAPSADFNSSAGDHLQVVAAQAAQRLRAAEERAKCAEDALAAVQARERAATEERAQLKRQLEDNEGLIKGLTEQLDVLNSKFSKQALRCRSLEQALATAQRAAVAARDAAAEGGGGGRGAEAEEAEMEHHGTIAQLLARITELESTLLSATHFAPQIAEGEAEAEAAAAEAAAAEAAAAEAEGDVVKPAAEAAQPVSTPAEVGSPTGPDATKSAAVLEADEAVAAPEAIEVVAAEKEEEPALPMDKADAAGAAATEPQAAAEVAADPPKTASAEGPSAGEAPINVAQEAASEAKTAEVDPAAPECAEGASKPPAALAEAAAVVSAAAPATTSANEAPIGSAGEAS